MSSDKYLQEVLDMKRLGHTKDSIRASFYIKYEKKGEQAQADAYEAIERVWNGEIPVHSYQKIKSQDFIAMDFPNREQILSPWLLKQGLNMIYSSRGYGKTYLSLYLAHAVSTGSPLLNWKSDKPHKVLYLDGEMPAPALQERLKQIIKYNIPPNGDHLYIVTPDTQNGLVLPDLATPKGQKQIDALIDGADLIIVDSISAWARRGGAENDAESWLSIQEWSLAHRAAGRSILFVHHAGKSGAQRGTSRREDHLDTVINLRRPQAYMPSDGAVFEIHYEKCRHLYGEDVNPIEAKLHTDSYGRQIWSYQGVKEVTEEQVLELKHEGLSQRAIAEELGVSQATVHRIIKRNKTESPRRGGADYAVKDD